MDAGSLLPKKSSPINDSPGLLDLGGAAGSFGGGFILG